MDDNFSEIMYSFCKHRIALLFSLLLVILFCMPLNFWNESGLRPQIGLICTYYWVEKKPYIFGVVSAFILGIAVDLCSATPLGINCLVLMIFAFVLNKIFYYLRPASFITDWLFFALSCFVIMLIKYLIFIIYFQLLPDYEAIILNIFSSIMFYPLIAYINDFIRNHFLPKERINE